MSNYLSLLFLPHRVSYISSVSKYLLVICAVLSLSLTAQAVADKSVAVATETNADSAAVPVFNSEAHNQVQKITVDLLAAIAASGSLLESDPETYFTAVDDVLSPVVDFNFISKVVMGRYGKAATAEQKTQFEQTFRRGLVVTYARGMANYADQNIIVLPPKNDVAAQRRVSVRQQVNDSGGDTHILAYTMARNKISGDWKLINVVMDGINLGKTFRSQFEQAVKKNNGDIDIVIDQWLSPDA